MLVLLIGPDHEANERLGVDLAEVLNWPFHAALDARGRRSLVEEIARDMIHAEDVHGSRVVVGWHVASILREAEARPHVAAATLAHVRRAIDWSAVMVFPVGDADSSTLALARALGAHVCPRIDPDDLFVAAPGLAFQILAAAKLLGLDDTSFGTGNA